MKAAYICLFLFCLFANAQITTYHLTQPIGQKLDGVGGYDVQIKGVDQHEKLRIEVLPDNGEEFSSGSIALLTNGFQNSYNQSQVLDGTSYSDGDGMVLVDADLTSFASGTYNLYVQRYSTTTNAIDSSVYYGPITVTKGNTNTYKPDLAPSIISLNADSLIPGEKLTVTIDVSNIGNFGSDSSETHYYLVPASKGISQDYYIGRDSQGDIDKGNTDVNESESETLDWDITVGDYKVYAIVDGAEELTEHNESNNLVSRPFSVRLPTPNITYEIYRISDTSGRIHSSAPGAAKTVFEDHEEVRITMLATNTGEPTNVYSMLNVRNSSNLQTVYRSPDSETSAIGDAVAHTIFNPVRENGTNYYSFTIPASSLGLGNFDVSGKIQHNQDGTVWDNTVNGAQTTNFSDPGWWKISQFSIIPTNLSPSLANLTASSTNGGITFSVDVSDPEGQTMKGWTAITDLNNSIISPQPEKEFTPADFGDSTQTSNYSINDLENLSLINGQRYKVRVRVRDTDGKESVDYIEFTYSAPVAKTPLPTPINLTLTPRSRSIVVNWQWDGTVNQRNDHADQIQISIRKLNPDGSDGEALPQVFINKTLESYTLGSTEGIESAQKYRIDVRYTAKTDSSQHEDSSGVNDEAETTALQAPSISSFTVIPQSNGDLVVNFRASDQEFDKLTATLHYPVTGQSLTYIDEIKTTLTSDYTPNTNFQFTISSREAGIYLSHGEGYVLQLWVASEDADRARGEGVATSDSASFTYTNPASAREDIAVRHRGHPGINKSPSLLWNGVNVSNGAFFYAETDYSVPSFTLPFHLTRYYNSLPYEEDDSLYPGGGQWKTNFHQWIRQYTDEDGVEILKILREDGSIDTFYQDGFGNYHTLNFGNFSIVTKGENGSFVVIDRNGNLFFYEDERTPEAGNTLHLLTKIQDHNENKITVVWENMRIQKVIDACSEEHFFHYNDDGLLVGVEDHTGDKVIYTHTTQRSIGSLLAFSSAKDLRDETCFYNYNPSSGNGALLLVNMYDKRGLGPYFQLNYDSSGRVFQFTDARNNITEFTYNVPDAQKSYTLVKTPIRNRSHAFEVGDLNIILAVRNASTEATPTPDGLTRSQSSVYDLDNTGDIRIAGLAESVTDWNGYTTNLDYNPLSGDISQVINRLGHISTPAYYAESNSTNLAEQNLSRIQSSVLNIGGREVARSQYEVDSIGQLTSHTAAVHETEELSSETAYDDWGRIKTVTDVRDNEWAYTYPDGNEPDSPPVLNRGFPTTITDPEGNTITYTYDLDGRQASITDKRNNTTTLVRDEDGNILSSSTTINGQLIKNQYRYDENGDLEETVLPEGEPFAEGSAAEDRWSINYTRDIQRNVTSISTPHSNSQKRLTVNVFNALNEQIDTINALTRTSSITIGKEGFVDLATAPLGQKTSIERDDNGNVTRTETDLEGDRTIVQESGYDEADRPIWNRWTRGTESQGVLIVRDDANFTVDTYTLNEDPERYVIDGTNISFATVTNFLRKERVVTDEAGRTIEYRRSSTEQARNDGADIFVTTEYRDSVDSVTINGTTHRKVSQIVTTPQAGIVTLDGQPRGKIIFTNNSLGHHIATQWTTNNETVLATEEYQRDPHGNATLTIRNDGSMIRKSFDLANRLIQTRFEKADGSAERSIFYTYNSNSWMTRIEDSKSGKSIETYLIDYNNAGQPTLLTNPDGQTLGLEYNLLGQITAMIYANGKRVTYGFDDADRMNQITDWLGNTIQYTFFKNNALKSTDYKNGMSCLQDYDSSGALSDLTTSLPDGTALGNTSISYRNALSQPLKSDGSVTMTRDYPLGVNAFDLLLENPANTLEASNYSYSQGENGIPQLSTQGSNSFKFGTPNSPEAERGLMTQVGNSLTSDQLNIAWNQTNQVTSIQNSSTGLSESYDYNVWFMRQSTITKASDEDGETEIGTAPATDFFWNPFAGLAQLIQEQKRDADGNLIQTASNIYSPYGITHRNTEAPGSPPTTHYYHSDELNNIYALTNTQGQPTNLYRYNPFGSSGEERLDGAITQPFQFIGNLGVQHDTATGMHYMRARLYHTASRRFISPDPILGDLMNPTTLNRYQYAGNNPYMMHDASGLFVKFLDPRIVQKMEEEFYGAYNYLFENVSNQIDYVKPTTVQDLKQSPPYELGLKVYNAGITLGESIAKSEIKHKSRNIHNECPSSEPVSGIDIKNRSWKRDAEAGEEFFHCGLECYRYNSFQCCYDNGELINYGACQGTYDYGSFDLNLPKFHPNNIPHITEDVITHFIFGDNYIGTPLNNIY